MADYLARVVVMTVFLGVISYLSYPGSSERALRIASSVLIIYTVALPVLSLAQDFAGENFSGEISDIADGGFDTGEETYIEVAENAFKTGIKEMLNSKYGIKKDNMRVYVFDLDFKNMRAGKIKIVLTGNAAFADWRGIMQYINESGLGKCEVEIELER